IVVDDECFTWDQPGHPFGLCRAWLPFSEYAIAQFKSFDVADLIQLAVVGRAVAVSQQENNFFEHTREDAILEQNESHTTEPPHKEAAHFGRVMDAQQFCRQHEPEPPASS